MTDYSNLLQRARDKASDYRQPYGCNAIIAALADAIEDLEARLVVDDAMVERALEGQSEIMRQNYSPCHHKTMRAAIEAALSQPKAGE